MQGYGDAVAGVLEGLVAAVIGLILCVILVAGASVAGCRASLRQARLDAQQGAVDAGAAEWSVEQATGERVFRWRNCQEAAR